MKIIKTEKHQKQAADFADPFTGVTRKEKLTQEELIRAVRFAIAAEYEAIQIYMQIAEATDDELTKKVMIDVADEERVHAGEFLKVLEKISPDEKDFYEEGEEEVEEMAEKTAQKNYLKNIFADDKKELIEELAELEHDQWWEWAKNILETEDISKEREERWKEKSFKPYEELTEEQKDMDREWAGKVLKIVKKHQDT